MKLYSTLMLMMGAFATIAQSQTAIHTKIDQQASQVEARVIEWQVAPSHEYHEVRLCAR